MRKLERKSIESILRTDLSKEDKFRLVFDKLEALIHKLSNQFSYCIEKEDAISILSIVVLRCIDKFNFEKQCKFITFFYNCAVNELQKTKNKYDRICDSSTNKENFEELKSAMEYDRSCDKVCISAPYTFSYERNNVCRDDVIRKIKDLIDNSKDVLNEEEVDLLEKRMFGGYQYNELGFETKDINRLKQRFRRLSQKLCDEKSEEIKEIIIKFN